MLDTPLGDRIIASIILSTVFLESNLSAKFSSEISIFKSTAVSS
jgi:hypothetical protein